MPGIVQTKIGFLGGAEIVEVTYQPKKVSVQKMISVLKRHRSFHAVHTNDKTTRRRASAFLKGRELRQQRGKLRFIKAKYTLRKQHPDLYYLPLSEAQAMKLNSWSYFGGAFPVRLTPAQQTLRLALQQKLRKNRRSLRQLKRLRPKRMGQARRAYQTRLQRWLKQK